MDKEKSIDLGGTMTILVTQKVVMGGYFGLLIYNINDHHSSDCLTAKKGFKSTVNQF